MREYFNAALGRWVVYLDDGSQRYRYRWVMEQHLGRDLSTDEHVHHVNGDPADDRLENLHVLSASDHQKLHAPERAARQRAKRGDRWALEYGECVECGTTERPHLALGLCERCYYRLHQRKKHGHAPRPQARIHHLTCEWCGEEFTRTSKQGVSRYCSRPCAGKGSAPLRWANRRARQAEAA